MATVKPCPEGMSWVSPYLIVKDANKIIEFYTKVFGFVKRFAMPGPDGRTKHAELAHKGSVIMLGEEDPKQGASAPKTIGGSPITLYTYVEDVDALAKRAKAAGAQILQEPADQFWGDRMCALVDPEGHHWAFATHVRDVDPSEMHPPAN
jgi:PhnB protein